MIAFFYHEDMKEIRPPGPAAVSLGFNDNGNPVRWPGLFCVSLSGCIPDWPILPRAMMPDQTVPV
jgi:hypothetical protein